MQEHFQKLSAAALKETQDKKAVAAAAEAAKKSETAAAATTSPVPESKPEIAATPVEPLALSNE
jgi:hypothetical protein